jgi:hypothetical protein
MVQDIKSDVSSEQSLTEHGARARILQTAETWELEGLRRMCASNQNGVSRSDVFSRSLAYLLNVIGTLASSSTSSSSCFALIRHMPVDFLSKATRATLVEKAFGILLEGDSNERIDVLAFIDKVAEETGYIAPLVNGHALNGTEDTTALTHFRPSQSSNAVTLLRFIDTYVSYSTAEEQHLVLSILGWAFE